MKEYQKKIKGIYNPNLFIYNDKGIFEKEKQFEIKRIQIWQMIETKEQKRKKEEEKQKRIENELLLLKLEKEIIIAANNFNKN